MNKDFSWANDHFVKYNELYRIYGNYYNGKHTNYFENFDEKNKNHEQLEIIIKNLKDNMCKVVVDSITSRLQLAGIKTDNEDTQAWIDDYFSTDRITSIAKAVHRDTILYGDAYLIVFPNAEGKPAIKHERPYNIAVKYNIDGEIEEAIKWVVEKIDDTSYKSYYWYYTADKIYSWTRDSVNFNITMDNVNIKEITNPYKKVPIFHFYNGIRKDAFCRSDLGDVVPLQIALNKELQSRELASDLNAFKQKWMTGVSVPVDENGEPIADLKSSIQNIWQFSNPDVKLGEFSATDLNNYTATINDLREEISRVSRVPFHVMGLGGNFPSGEALKTAEAPLIAKIQDKQLIFGDTWEDVFKMVLNIAEKPFKSLSAMWEDTQPHNEKETWEISLLKKDAGVSNEQILSEQGYTQEEIEDFNQKAQEKAQQNLSMFNGVGGV